MKERLLLAGVSTRAMAASAIRAGHSVIAVESFRDLDHPALPDVISLERDLEQRFSAARAAVVARALRADAACYAASFENDGDAVAELASGRTLWGNSPEVLAQVRNPILLERVIRQAGLPTARVRASQLPGGEGTDWLLKPRRSGGGQRIRALKSGRAVPRWGYLQERIRGIPGSLLFVADGEQAVPVALTRQIIGDRRFGAAGFRYVGNLIGPAGTPLFPREAELLQMAARMADIATRRFGLSGINGIDFMARDGVAYLTEINPRWTGAAEVAERAYGVPLFAWHRDSYRGVLPDFSLERARRRGAVHGKAIVFARQDLRAGATTQWLGADWVADIPHPGDIAQRGQPVCTVFSTQTTPEATIVGLVTAQERFLGWVHPLKERAA